MFGAELAAGASQAELWRGRGRRAGPAARRAGAAEPAAARRQRATRCRGATGRAFEIEVELLLDWYWPALKGAPAPPSVRAEFLALWAPVLDRLLALPGGWFLRDYHSPNLIWLPRARRASPGSASSTSRTRSTSTPPSTWSRCCRMRASTCRRSWRRELFAHYCAEVAAREPAFDRAAFAAAYADFGAQRNTRLLGLWVRLLKRDGKPQYLQHIPRTWGYLERNLRAPALGAAGGVVRPALPGSLRSGKPAGLRTEEGDRGDGRHVDNGDGAGRRARHAHGARQQQRCPSRWCSCSGKALIDHVLDRLAEAGIERAVVNVHHKADLIEQHLKRAARRRASRSPTSAAALLDTGGGVKKALPRLGAGRLPDPQRRLGVDRGRGLQPGAPDAAAWDDARMDCLLMLALASAQPRLSGPRRLRARERRAHPPPQRVEQEMVPFAFTGVSIAHPRLFEGSPEGAFSLNVVWSRAIAAGRAYGMRMDGMWMHVGTPAALARSRAVPERRCSRSESRRGQRLRTAQPHLHGSAGHGRS